MIDGKKFKTKKIIPLTKKTRTTIKKDLEKYRKLAKEFGAADSKIIPADRVSFDERVRLKCRVPPKEHFYKIIRKST